MIFFADGLVQLWDTEHPNPNQFINPSGTCTSVVTDSTYESKLVGKLLGEHTLGEAPDEFDFQTSAGNPIEITVATFSHLE